jgi:hypothetical protein
MKICSQFTFVTERVLITLDFFVNCFRVARPFLLRMLRVLELNERAAVPGIELPMSGLTREPNVDMKHAALFLRLFSNRCDQCIMSVVDDCN